MSEIKVTVIGIGAMGGGMARVLVDSSVTSLVCGYDRAEQLVHDFQADAKEKAPPSPPKSLKEAVSAETDCVVLALVNQVQCESVCQELIAIMRPESTLIVTSTVTADWAIRTAKTFDDKSIYFVDCPVSGGPVRARQGDLTLMVSGDEQSLQVAKPILDAMGQSSIIQGGVGMGSTVKMVHQLLAGVHICAAAEALSLAAVAGLDVTQMYEIVNGAAGASWMFKDRGARMIDGNEEIVKSQLALFVKDLDIVYAEAKRLRAPIPLASAALQQFISGQSLGLTRKDDSQVIRVYESITGKPARGTPKKEGNEVGDLWVMKDGTVEEIQEVGAEPRHQIVLQNDYVRALRVSFPPNDTTLAHRHAEDSIYFFLVEGDDGKLNVINHVKGNAPACDCMDFGEIRYGTHKTDQPLVHKITNKSNVTMLCIDAEVLSKPPITSPLPLVAEFHELVKTRDKCRVYKLELTPGQSVNITYPFYHLTVVLRPGTVKNESAGMFSWEEPYELGDLAWKEPVANLTRTNTGESTFVQYIAEWR